MPEPFGPSTICPTSSGFSTSLSVGHNLFQLSRSQIIIVLSCVNITSAHFRVLHFID